MATLHHVDDIGTNQIAIEDLSAAPFIEWARPLHWSQDVLEEVNQLRIVCGPPESLDLARSIHCGDRTRHAEYLILMLGTDKYTVLARNDYDDVVLWIALDDEDAEQVYEGFRRWCRTLDGAS